MNLKLVPCFPFYKKYEIHISYETYSSICEPKFIKIDKGLTKLLEIKSGAVFLAHMV